MEEYDLWRSRPDDDSDRDALEDSDGDALGDGLPNGSDGGRSSVEDDDDDELLLSDDDAGSDSRPGEAASDALARWRDAMVRVQAALTRVRDAAMAEEASRVLPRKKDRQKSRHEVKLAQEELAEAQAELTKAEIEKERLRAAQKVEAKRKRLEATKRVQTVRDKRASAQKAASDKLKADHRELIEKKKGSPEATKVQRAEMAARAKAKIDTEKNAGKDERVAMEERQKEAILKLKKNIMLARNGMLPPAPPRPRDKAKEEKKRPLRQLIKPEILEADQDDEFGGVVPETSAIGGLQASATVDEDNGGGESARDMDDDEEMEPPDEDNEDEDYDDRMGDFDDEGPGAERPPREFKLITDEMMKRAREAQREHLVKRQITFTNVSYTFNSFKFLEMPARFKDFFLIEHTPPGRMSAGTSCPITITFSPQVNEDISDIFPIISETGRVDIPFECTTRKCKIVFSQKVLDFGAVVVAETKTLHLTISSEGALPTSFKMKRIAVLGSASPFMYKGTNADIPGYSSVTFEAVFAPATTSGTFKEKVVFEFSEKTVEPVEVCSVGELYREAIVVRNDAKTALRVEVFIPKEYEAELLPQPKVSFVQASTTHTIMMRFIPSMEMLELIKKREPTDGPENYVEIPARISVLDQTLPLEFTVKAQITQATLLFDPKEIDFGKCPLEESSVSSIRITNTALIPQKFAFLNPPKAISISPGAGLATLLPHETMAMELVFSPQAATEFTAVLNCSTIREKFEIPCKGLGVEVPLRLSHSTILMAPAALGKIQTCSVILENTTFAQHSFDFIPTAESFLKALLPSAPQVPAKDAKEEKLPPPAVPSDTKWLIPCYTKTAPEAPPIFLAVQTYVRAPLLAVRDAVSALDFGKTPSGQWSVQSFVVENLSDDPLEVPTVALPPSSFLGLITTQLRSNLLSNEFSLVRCLRKLLPKESATIAVSVEVKLKGCCVQPLISVKPSEQVVKVGPTLANNPSYCEFTQLVNGSEFTVSFVADLRRNGPSNINHLNPFSVTPRADTILAGQSKVLTITFQPDHERDPFIDVLDITFENTRIKHTVRLEGSCTGNRGMFVVAPPAPTSAAQRPWTLDPAVEMWMMTDYHASVATPVIASSRAIEIVLEYDGGPEPAVGQLPVGNAAVAKGQPGELVTEPLSAAAVKDGFSVDYPKSNIEPGQVRPIVFKFMPPKEADTLQKAQVETRLKFVMKGGYTPNERVDGTAVNIILVGRTKKN
eukprot:m51a1_g61 hypothetical protein (1236) ;mRNA; r:202598-207711